MKHVYDETISPVRKRLLELQDLLEVRNQLERIPSCKAKDALLSEIESQLELSGHSASRQRTDVHLEPMSIAHSGVDLSPPSWTPKEVRFSRLLWLVVLLLVVLYFIVNNSCVPR